MKKSMIFLFIPLIRLLDDQYSQSLSIPQHLQTKELRGQFVKILALLFRSVPVIVNLAIPCEPD
jgi:hypothetical protein